MGPGDYAVLVDCRFGFFAVFLLHSFWSFFEVLLRFFWSSFEFLLRNPKEPQNEYETNITGI
jgi:hypothetical protein